MSSLGREDASLRRRAAASSAAIEAAVGAEDEAARRFAALRLEVLPVPTVVLVVLVGAGTIVAEYIVEIAYAIILKTVLGSV